MAKLSMFLHFQLFDKGAKGYITQAELGEMLFNAFGMEDDEIGTLFAQVDQDQDDKITFGKLTIVFYR